MHLFLTGGPGAGKSHIASLCANAWPGEILGFRSWKRTVPCSKGMQAEVVFTDRASPRKEHIAAKIADDSKHLFPQVFETAGVQALARIQPGFAGLAVMDEIGYIESASPLFQAEVERVLELGAPVLAVLRQDTSDFLNRLFSRKDAIVLTLSPQSRQQVEKQALAWLQKQAQAYY